MVAHCVILDPTAPSGSAPRHEPKALDGLRGKAVGFIDNAKPNFHFLVDDLAEIFLSRYGVASIVKHRKRSASIPAPQPVYADVKEHCDLVITGSGD